MYKIYTNKWGIRNPYIHKILLIMRLTTVFLIATIMQVSASGFAQKVTYRKKNASLTELFTVIKRQTGYNVVWNNEELAAAKPVTVNFVNTDLSEVLAKSLSGMSIAYTIEEKTIVIKRTEKTILDRVADYFKVIDVDGRILDEKRQPLAGATVRVKGSSKAVVTGEGGYFLLKDVDENATLVVTYLGYKMKEIPANQSRPLIINLEILSAQLDNVEIVNTGYQTLSKERSAGSFAKPDMKILAGRTGSMNVLQRLDGLVPGFTVNNAPNRVPLSPTDPGQNDPFIIRGITSINASRNPLYVVDGIAIDDISFVNPQDVADITVLKDATAASIWGARASNGVVVIMTKKGGLNDKTRITYDGFVNMKGKPNLNYIPVLSSSQFIQAARETFNPTAYPYADISAYEGSYSTGIAPHEMFLYGYNHAGAAITPAQANASLDSLAAINNNRQIEDLWYRNAMLMNHTLSASGGSNAYSFYGSMAYTDNQSNRPGEKNAAYKLNLRQDFSLGQRIKLYVITDLNNTQASAKRTINVDNTFYPYQLFEDAAGSHLNIPYMQYLAEPTRIDYQNRSRINLNYNPLDEQDFGYTKGENMLSRIASGVTVNLLKGLRFEGVYGYLRGNNRIRNYDDAKSYKVRSELVQFTVAANAGVTPVYNLPTTGGTYAVDNMMQRNWTVRNQLAYDKSWKGDLHQLTVLAGQEAQEQFSVTESSKVRGYDEALQTFGNVNYATLASGIFSPVMGNYGMSSLSNDSFRTTENQSRFTSYYGNIAYTYNRKYSLNGSWRIDQSNLFGKDKSAQNRPVMSGGLKWQISEENFLKEVKWLNRLAIRTTYGITGNSLPAGSGGSYDILRAGSSTFYAGGAGLSITTPGNSTLSWESTATLNAGIDFEVFNRLTGAIDIYQKKTKDLFGTLSLNPFSGYASIDGNSGTLENKGIEFSLSSTNIQHPDFSWHTTFIGAYNKNTVTKIVREYPVTSAESKLGLGFAEGYPAFAIFAYKYAGLDHQGRPQIERADGSVTAVYNAATMDDVIYAGTYQPVWNGSLSNNFRYQGFELTANVSYSLGHVMRRDVNGFYTGRITHNNVANSNDGFTTGNLNSEFANRWRQPGDEAFTDIPAYIANESSSYTTRNVGYYIQGDVNVVSASYIKMRDVTLSYNLPQSFIQKIKVSTVALSLQLSNVMLWKANKYGIDPEFQNTISGTRTLPVDQHSITIGVHAGF